MRRDSNLEPVAIAGADTYGLLHVWPESQQVQLGGGKVKRESREKELPDQNAVDETLYFECVLTPKGWAIYHRDSARSHNRAEP